MKKALLASLLGLSILACPLLYFIAGPELDAGQLRVLRTLLIIAACSGLYCFVVGEITRNNSQMDKLWSILPAVYTWIIAVNGGMATRLVIMASLATAWGIRLTWNFARKGAYSLKFWTGKEDYRWEVLRSRKEFQPRWKWMVFDLFFISVYQNALVLAICFPALVSLGSPTATNWIDVLAAVLMAGFILLETVADEQQWRFQSVKWKMIGQGLKLEDLPEPYNKGFNTTGLWGRSRHPNYFAEQSIWVCFYIFSVAAGTGIFNWSLIGALLLIVLFLGSSSFAEEISMTKYPAYAEYRSRVPRFIPWKNNN